MKRVKITFWLLLVSTGVAFTGVDHFSRAGSYYSPDHWLANATGFLACAGLAALGVMLVVGSIFKHD